MIRVMTQSEIDLNRAEHGLRNEYIAAIGTQTYHELLAMTCEGYAVAGAVRNDGGEQSFHATRFGCEFAGLSKAATKRAMSSSWMALVASEWRRKERP
jgi:hypothetical protein